MNDHALGDVDETAVVDARQAAAHDLHGDVALGVQHRAHDVARAI